ncbi:MAG TPA: PadR family transcriptional regulator [Candidatus Solibacter sp.]|jgi:DNA-binding PadR family transcriptional regulator|nr:PadR family transcriptional regulator [Candidatus Solibacter sp.]
MSKEHWSWGFPGHRPWAAFAFGQTGRFFEAGEVRLAILSLLSEGPKHGYQLMKEMAERSGGLYKASAGSVYPTLQQLEDEELIQADQQAGKKVYRITEAGLGELAKAPDHVRRIWERAERWEDWGQCFGPESMGVLQPISRLVKASLHATRRSGPDRVRTVLERVCRELEDL